MPIQTPLFTGLGVIANKPGFKNHYNTNKINKEKKCKNNYLYNNGKRFTRFNLRFIYVFNKNSKNDKTKLNDNINNYRPSQIAIN